MKKYESPEIEVISIEPDESIADVSVSFGVDFEPDPEDEET